MSDQPDPIVERIEADAARQAKAARGTYTSRMKLLRTEFLKQGRVLAAEEKEELKRIERWRVTSIAAVEKRPVPLADLRSVKPGEESRDDGGASPRTVRARGRTS